METFYKNVREKCDLIRQNIMEKCDEDLIDGAELAYMIGCDSKCIAKLEHYIKEYSADGIDTFGLFVKECLNWYKESDCCSLSEFVDYDLEQCMTNFIEKYFIEEE